MATTSRTQSEPTSLAAAVAAGAVVELVVQDKRSRKAKASRPKLIWRKRDQQDSRLYNLKLDLNDLRLEISKLQQQRLLLQAQSLNRHDDIDGHGVKMVLEYFKVFERGFLASPVDAIAFLGNIMSDDVMVNNFKGRDMMVEQWRMHSSCFNSEFTFRFLQSHVVVHSKLRASVMATARFSAIITHQTLQYMFPHILGYAPVVDQLIGQWVIGDGQYEFEFDAKKGQIVRCGVVLDFFSVFAKLLPNPRELAMLFNQALLTDEFYIGELENERAEAAAAAAAAKSPQRSFRVVDILNDDDEVVDLGDVVSSASGDACTPSGSPISVSSPPLTKMQLDHILGDADVADVEFAQDAYAGGHAPGAAY